MPDILVGCRTDMPEPHKDRFYTLEMYCHYYPHQRDFDALVEFLQPYTTEIVDEIVFIIDKDTRDLIWEKTDE